VILEVARTLSKLIKEGKIERPLRSIRFIWPPEVEGTLTLLNARPDITKRIKAVIHMDMVGGGPETKAVFHVTRGPASLPSFVNDVAEAFGEFVNEQSYRFAATGSAAYPFVAPEGGKEPLMADFAEFSQGSDHEVYSDSSFAIPAIYLNDWPDRYIHTNFDTAANIDPTKLKRASFIGGASGYFLANASAADAESAWSAIRNRSVRRLALMLDRRSSLSSVESMNMTLFHYEYERKLFDSMRSFFVIPAGVRSEAKFLFENNIDTAGGYAPPPLPHPDYRTVFKRNPDIKGTMGAFGYNYFSDKYGAEKAAAVRLLRHQGLRGTGADYAYEVLNLADGKRSVQEIRNAVSAIYGPVPIEIVLEYLRALETIRVVIAGPLQTSFRQTPEGETPLLDDAGEECQAAIAIAQAFLPTVTKPQEWKLTVAKNLLVDGPDCCNPLIWRLTYRRRTLITETGLRGKGGQLFLEVNVKAKEAKLLGWGE